MSSNVDRVEVFAGIQRRRKYSADQKLAVVQEAAQPGMTISYVARRHGIAPSLIFGWRRRMSEGGKEAIRALGMSGLIGATPSPQGATSVGWVEQ
jgi:transposase